jgi:hypothetical protein
VIGGCDADSTPRSPIDRLTAFKPRFGLVKMKGVSYVDGQKVVEGDFQFAMVVEKK